MATTVWRISGIDTFGGGDLELSEIHLYDMFGRADVGAVLTSSHQPISGSLAALADSDIQTGCRFAAADARSPGFYIQWALPSAKDITRVRLGCGADRARACSRLQIQALIDGLWFSNAASDSYRYQYQLPSANAWYPEAAPQVSVRQFLDEVIIDSGTEAVVTVPPNSLAGDLLLTFVMHRSALDVPAGWSLLVTSPVASDAGVNQWQSVLSKPKTLGGAATETVTVKQAVAGRLIAGCVAVNTGGLMPQIDLLADAVSGSMQGQDVLPIDVKPCGLGIASLSQVQVAVVIGSWTAPSTWTGMFGVSASGSLQRRLAAGYTAQEGLISGYFKAPPVEDAPTAKTRISLSIFPANGQTVLLTERSPVTARLQASIRLPSLSQPPAQGLQSMARHLSSKLLDVECGGQGRIYGTVARKSTPANAPLRRRVRLHRSVDGYLARETWSKADGSYEFREISTRYEWDVIAWDNELQEFSTVANNQLAEVMP